MLAPISIASNFHLRQWRAPRQRCRYWRYAPGQALPLACAPVPEVHGACPCRRGHEAAFHCSCFRPDTTVAAQSFERGSYIIVERQDGQSPPRIGGKLVDIGLAANCAQTRHVLGEAAMGQVLVRNLDDRVNESWKIKSSQGQSLEQLGQELRDVLTTSLPKR
jgi:hypothetical protein